MGPDHPDFDFSPEVRGTDGSSFIFFPTARNVWAFFPGQAADVPVPPEPNPPTSAKWKPEPIKIKKYVDDGIQIEKINMETALEEERNGRKFRVKHAVPSQNVFCHIIRKAVARGMKVNAAKTAMICISDALASKSEAYIDDGEGNIIKSEDHLKLLGFHFGPRPNVAVHIESLRKRFRRRTWIMMHLRHAGFNEEELAKVYRVIIRPVADYLSVVYHSMLTDQQDEIIERLQSQALKIIYGKDMKYADMREKAGVTTLRARRIEACDKFASKCAFFLHLPSHNRWHETSAIVGPEEYVGIEITPAIEKALSGYSFSIL